MGSTGYAPGTPCSADLAAADVAGQARFRTGPSGRTSYFPVSDPGLADPPGAASAILRPAAA